MIFFNYVGLLMLLVSFGLTFGIGSLVGLGPKGEFMMVAGPVALALDVWYRRKRGDGDWFLPTSGGSIFFAPVWLWGAVWSVMGVVNLMER